MGKGSAGGEGSGLDTLMFLERFLASPARVGSAVPSSRYLAQEMVGAVDWSGARTVVELGAGSGAITAAIWPRLRPDTTFVAFERDPAFHPHLRARFPGLHLATDAAGLHQVVPAAAAGQVDAVLCGLPLALFTTTARDHLLAEVYAALRPGGRFVAFQYTPVLQVSLRRLYRHVRRAYVPWNLPPAFVYRCEK